MGRDEGGVVLCVEDVLDVVVGFVLGEEVGLLRAKGSVFARLIPGVGSGGLEVGGLEISSLEDDVVDELFLRKCCERW